MRYDADNDSSTYDVCVGFNRTDAQADQQAHNAIDRYAPYFYDATMVVARALHQLLLQQTTDNIVGAQLRDSMVEQSFVRATGHISFNEAGDRDGGILYEVLNHAGDSRLQRVAFHSSSRYSECTDDCHPVVWSSGAERPQDGTCEAGRVFRAEANRCEPCEAGTFHDSQAEDCLPCMGMVPKTSHLYVGLLGAMVSEDGLHESRAYIIVMYVWMSDIGRLMEQAYASGVGGEGYVWIVSESGKNLQRIYDSMSSELSIEEKNHILQGYFGMVISVNTSTPECMAYAERWAAQPATVDAQTGKCSEALDDVGSPIWLRPYNDSTQFYCMGADVNASDPFHNIAMMSHDAVFVVSKALHELVEVRGRIEIDGWELMEAMLEQSFTGLTGLLEFKSDGDRTGDVSYEVVRAEDGTVPPTSYVNIGVAGGLVGNVSGSMQNLGWGGEHVAAIALAIAEVNRDGLLLPSTKLRFLLQDSNLDDRAVDTLHGFFIRGSELDLGQRLATTKEWIDQSSGGGETDDCKHKGDEGGGGEPENGTKDSELALLGEPSSSAATPRKHLGREAKLAELLEFAKGSEMAQVHHFRLNWQMHRSIRSVELSEMHKQERGAIVHIGFLFAAYKPQYWFFELLETFRKLVFVAIPVLLDDPGNQLLNSMIICLLYVACLHCCQPNSHGLNRAVKITCAYVLLMNNFYAWMMLAGLDDADGNENFFSMGLVIINNFAFFGPAFLSMYVLVLGSFVEMRIDWPKDLEQALSQLNINRYLSLDLAGLHCILPSNFYRRYYMVLVTIMSIVSLFGILALGSRWCIRESRDQQVFQMITLKAVIFVLFFCYPFFCSRLLLAFPCRRIYEVTYLMHDYSEECFSAAH
eukprot:gene28293-35048_t